MELDGKSLPGFDREKHAAYFLLGYCPSVHSSKAYCVQREGHAGEHFSVYLNPDGTLRIGARWG